MPEASEVNGVYKPDIQRVPTGEFFSPSRKTNGVGVQAEDTRICVIMVGLPARGKSLIAQKGSSRLPMACQCLLQDNSRQIPPLAFHKSKDLQCWSIPPDCHTEPHRRLL